MVVDAISRMFSSSRQLVPFHQPSQVVRGNPGYPGTTVASAHQQITADDERRQILIAQCILPLLNSFQLHILFI